jgi:hypothetical protein
MIKIIHYAGFFSCCSVKLHYIAEFINSNKRLPDNVDSLGAFTLYKKDKDKNKDISLDYFEDFNILTNDNIIYSIDYRETYQFKNYKDLDYKSIIPLVKKYFSPSVKINKTIKYIEEKYNIVHDNTIVVYYRGCDKRIETQLASFDEFYYQIIKIADVYKNMDILLQSDSAGFVDYIKDKKLNNIKIVYENKCSYSDAGIHTTQSHDENYYHMINFLSTVLIISKCKYIICSSGNVSIWMMLYRGNCKNVIQYLNGNWYNNTCLFD